MKEKTKKILRVILCILFKCIEIPLILGFVALVVFGLGWVTQLPYIGQIVGWIFFILFILFMGLLFWENNMNFIKRRLIK